MPADSQLTITGRELSDTAVVTSMVYDTRNGLPFVEQGSVLLAIDAMCQVVAEAPLTLQYVVGRSAPLMY